MLLLARRQGYVQLAEPQRFDARVGTRRDPAAARRGRDRPSRVRAAWPAPRRQRRRRLPSRRTGAGLPTTWRALDSVLIARTEDHARELSRRARDDLIRYGRVAPGPAVALAAGEAGQRRGPDHGPAQRPRRPRRAGRPRAGQPRRPPHHRGRRWPARQPRRGPPSAWGATRRPGVRVVGRVLPSAAVPARPRHPRLRAPPRTPRSAGPPAPRTCWSTAWSRGSGCTSR